MRFHDQYINSEQETLQSKASVKEKHINFRLLPRRYFIKLYLTKLFGNLISQGSFTLDFIGLLYLFEHS